MTSKVLQYVFGAHVRLLRRQRDLSQEELATLAGVHRTYIGMVERGEKNITLKNIVKLADALDLPPKLLMECFEHGK